MMDVLMLLILLLCFGSMKLLADFCEKVISAPKKKKVLSGGK